MVPKGGTVESEDEWLGHMTTESGVCNLNSGLTLGPWEDFLYNYPHSNQV